MTHEIEPIIINPEKTEKKVPRITSEDLEKNIRNLSQETIDKVGPCPEPNWEREWIDYEERHMGREPREKKDVP